MLIINEMWNDISYIRFILNEYDEMILYWYEVDIVLMMLM